MTLFQPQKTPAEFGATGPTLAPVRESRGIFCDFGLRIAGSKLTTIGVGRRGSGFGVVSGHLQSAPSALRNPKFAIRNSPVTDFGGIAS